MLDLKLLLQIAGVFPGKHIYEGVGWEEMDYEYAGKSCFKNRTLGVRDRICKQNQLFLNEHVFLLTFS